MSNKTMYEKEKEITDKIDVKEAIKMFQNLIFVENHKIAENHCRKLAIEALEKQIPKKPIVKSYFCHYVNYQDFLCPYCRNHIILKVDGNFIAGKKQQYCPNCGQALDWSEQNG